MSDLEIYVSLPDSDAARAARHVEQLGLDGVTVPDLTPGDDALILLAAAAGATNRLSLSTGVLVLPTRQLVALAAQVGTLQRVCGNRLVLGVGIGGFPGTPMWRAMGGPARDRGRRTDAMLDLLPGLIAGRQTEVDGEQVTLKPAPVPPIVVGGNSDAALRRASTRGHGWAPSLMTAEDLADRVNDFQALAMDLGHERLEVDYGTHAMISTSDAERDAFGDRLAGLFGMPAQQARSLPIAGGVREVADRLAAYHAAGADRVRLSVDGRRWARDCELLAEARALL